MSKIIYAFIFLSFAISANAQKEFKTVKREDSAFRKPGEVLHSEKFNKQIKNADEKHVDLTPISKLNSNKISRPIQVYQIDENKMPILIKGYLDDFENDITRQTYTYLEKVANFFKIKDAKNEWEISSIEIDQIGMQHIRVRQLFKGISVQNGELTLHAKNGRIETLMGRGFPSPNLENVTPILSLKDAERIAQEFLQKNGRYKEIQPSLAKKLDIQQFETELTIYHVNNISSNEVLAYFVKAFENISSQKSFFIDANTGEIIHQFEMICKFSENPPPPDGPKTANEKDLNNITRTLNTYEFQNTFYLIDASKSMFKASQSSFPNDPVGVIVTLDALNNTPESDNFKYTDLKTSNNIWNNPGAVSAHFNAGIAFDYYKNVHNRESINGSGGNIFSFINVTDEDDKDMDNAFWNSAMWYGNGDTSFRPLAGSLDVAGHEMTHGVVQSSANLEYQGESGALNESFADVFATMIDREDYKIGEDVVLSNVFPSGALRDLSNPNNGGSQLGDNGWQPNHTSQQYLGGEDNGGVHINSGIPNHAFFKFAQSVGKDKAEQVYYRALTKYLTKSSKFVDLRNAIVQSASDLYSSNEVNAANLAFDQVGINEAPSGNYQNDSSQNPGDDYIIFADADLTVLKIADANLDLVLDPAADSSPISRPSITDDGSIILFVNDSKQIEAIFINWDSGAVEGQIIQSEKIWSNVVISKEGNRMAAITDATDNIIQVYDFNLQEWFSTFEDGVQVFGFQLFNPTYTEGISTGDVQYADALEFDFTGEILMYDAYSEISGNNGQKIGYWDIGFLDVFNNSIGNWGNGSIGKLFSQLDEGISVGNPTFAKNSPYIVAFDYLEDQDIAILGANIETGKVSQIFENSSISYPSYTGDDQQMIFTSEGIFGFDLFILNLNPDKISTVANSEGILIEDARFGVAFRNGNRPLTDVDDFIPKENTLKVFPNPSSDFLFFDIKSDQNQKSKLQIINIEGKIVFSMNIFLHQGENRNMIPISGLPNGNYIVKLSSDKLNNTVMFSKI